MWMRPIGHAGISRIVRNEPLCFRVLHFDRALKRNFQKTSSTGKELVYWMPAGGRMFSHIFVGSDDVATSKKFYDAVLGAIGVPEGKLDAKGRVFYRTPSGAFGISKPIDGNPATHANGGTIGFSCDSPDKVKAFHDAGVASGGKSIEDPPGWREGGAVKLYLAYLRDPFGNKICALYRG
jgi:catechol 2,3-dioxygenase-like lactoylglutathione lyase family enzyme